MTRMKTIPQNEILKLDNELSSSADTMYLLKDSVTQYVDNSVVSEAIVVSSLHDIWENIVGKDISKHVQIRHIKNEVLHVVADHRAWSTQLKYITKDIIEKINSELKDQKISSISLSISSKKS